MSNDWLPFILISGVVVVYPYETCPSFREQASERYGGLTRR